MTRILACAIAAILVLCIGARASDVSERSERICGSANYRIVLTGVSKHRDTCAGTHNCFSFAVKCSNGRQYAGLTSRLNPQALEVETWLADVYPVWHIVFGVLLV